MFSILIDVKRRGHFSVIVLDGHYRCSQARSMYRCMCGGAGEGVCSVGRIQIME